MHYLILKKRPAKIMSVQQAEVDWSKTKAWGWGGYHAHVFLNVKRTPRKR
jgi:predicted AlkP superfamily phosphohydrolase/phosphomutase